MSEFLQGTPGLRFSLALVEICLYKMSEDEEYPLILQPRRIANTVDLVRAVVHVEAPEQVKVDVTLHEEADTGTRSGGRRKLTEEIFFTELSENTDAEKAQQVSSLIDSMRQLGVEPTWRSASVSMRFPDPGLSGYKFTMVILNTNGTFSLGYLERISISGGYDKEIALDYLEGVARDVGIPRVYKRETWYGTDPEGVCKLINNADAFLEHVGQLIDRLREAADVDS